MTTKYSFDLEKIISDLRSKRNRLGINNERTALRIGIPYNTLKNYLTSRGKQASMMRTTELIPILKWLGTKLDDYIIETEKEESSGDE